MNTHGTFERVARIDSKDLEGYQIKDEDLSSSASAPQNKFKYALMALPVIAILCGVAIVTSGAASSSVGTFH